MGEQKREYEKQIDQMGKKLLNKSKKGGGKGQNKSSLVSKYKA